MTLETHPIDKELVMAYLDGELTPEQATRVAIHLENCGECRELAAELRDISTQMLAWVVEPPPKNLNDSITKSPSGAGANESRIPLSYKQTGKFDWAVLLRRQWLWATGGAAAVVLCIIIVVFHSFQSERGAAAPPEARFALSGSLNRAVADYSPKSVDRIQSAPAPPPAATEPPSIGPMIARTASLNISVKEFNAARASMDGIVRGHGGYVSSLNISAEKGSPQSLTAKLMVPAAQLDAALSDLKALGHVEHEEQGGEEVTSQVVDLDARLKNARKTETQLTNILNTRTGKITNVLEVEKEMARVRGEIEGMEAEQKELQNRISFASIDLNLSEEYQAQLADGQFTAVRKIRNALVDGSHAAIDGLLSVCIFLFSVWPSLLLWGLILFWPARWIWLRMRKSRGEDGANG